MVTTEVEFSAAENSKIGGKLDAGNSRFTCLKKKPVTKPVEPSLEPEQKKIRIDHLINGEGIVYE